VSDCSHEVKALQEQGRKFNKLGGVSENFSPRPPSKLLRPPSHKRRFEAWHGASTELLARWEGYNYDLISLLFSPNG